MRKWMLVLGMCSSLFMWDCHGDAPQQQDGQTQLDAGLEKHVQEISQEERVPETLHKEEIQEPPTPKIVPPPTLAWYHHQNVAGLWWPRVAFDKQGYVYYGSSARTSFTWDNFTFPGGCNSPFVLKLDGNGKLVWAAELSKCPSGGYLSLFLQGLYVMDSGEIVVIGRYHGTPTFGKTTLKESRQGPSATFVAKLNAQGKWLWAKGIQYEVDDTKVLHLDIEHHVGHHLVVDQQGNIYLGGEITHNRVVFDEKTYSRLGKRDLTLTKLSPDGKLLWFKQFAGKEYDTINSLQIDAKGEVYVLGSFSLDLRFGDQVLPVGSHGSGLFLAKCSAEGEWRWGKMLMTPASPYGKFFRLTSDGGFLFVGNVLSGAEFAGQTIKGEKYSHLFTVAKLDKDLKVMWRRDGSVKGEQNSALWLGNIAVDVLGNIYFAGTFQGEMSFGDDFVKRDKEQHAYILKLNTQKRWEWIKLFKQSWTGRVYIDQKQGAYYATPFCGDVNIDGISFTSNPELTDCRSQGADSFIAKFDQQTP